MRNIGRKVYGSARYSEIAERCVLQSPFLSSGKALPPLFVLLASEPILKARHIYVVQDGDEIRLNDAYDQLLERARRPENPEGAARPSRQREVAQNDGVDRRHDQAGAENRGEDADVRRAALLAALSAAQVVERLRADVEQPEQGGAPPARG